MRGLLWAALAGLALWLLLRAAARAGSAAGIPERAAPDAPGIDYTPNSDAQSQPPALAPVNTYGDALDNILQAWALSEGNSPGNRNWRNNNPGNLKASAWEGAAGKDSGGFAQFADVGDGWDALTAWLTRLVTKHPDWDLYDVTAYGLRGSTTAPTVDDQGDSDAKADFIAGYTGLDPTQPLGSLLGIGS